MFSFVFLLARSLDFKFHPIPDDDLIDFIHFLVDLFSDLPVIEGYEVRVISWLENSMTFEFEAFARVLERTVILFAVKSRYY